MLNYVNNVFVNRWLRAFNSIVGLCQSGVVYKFLQNISKNINNHSLDGVSSFAN